MLQFGFDVNKNLKQRFQITCIATAILYFIFMTSTILVYDKLFPPENQIDFVLTFVVANTYTTLFLIGFCMIVYAVQRRYEVINECIMKIFKTEEDDEADSIANAEDLIIKLANLHDLMNDVVVDMNECCSFEVSEMREELLEMLIDFFNRS